MPNSFCNQNYSIMKTLGLVAALLMLSGFAPQTDKHAGTYVCTSGKVHFFSKAPLEDIEATTESALCVLNTDTRKVSSVIKQNSFVFKDKLMQEHFNENYMESDKYPNAKLDMVVQEDIDYTKDGTYPITLKGTLEMHGVSQQREIKGQLIVKDGAPYRATAEFDVKLEDHKIKVPKAVMMNIAEVVKVDVDFMLQKYEKK